MIRPVALLFILFFSFGGLADTPKGCEPLLLSSFEALTKYALEQKIIDVSNIQALVNSDKPINPISNSGQTAAAAKVREAFIKMVAQIGPEDWSQIQRRLSTTLEQLLTNDQTKHSARKDTRRVLDPKLVGDLNLPYEAGLFKADWSSTKPLTLTLDVLREVNIPDIKAPGIQINQKERPPNLWKQTTERLRQIDSPELKHAQLDQVLSVAENIHIVLTKEMLDYSSQGSVFLVKDQSVYSVARLSDLSQVNHCVQLNSGHVDCLFRRRHVWTYVRINNLGQAEKVVDLQNRRPGFPPEDCRVTHLSDGTPLVASTLGSDGVEIFKPLDSDKPIASLPLKTIEVNWIRGINDEVYLAVNGAPGNYLIEPFAGTSAKTKLPISFPITNLTSIIGENGQVYVASQVNSWIQILKLYGEVEE